MGWQERITRKEMLKSAAVSAALLGLGSRERAASQDKESSRARGMNVVLFLTDQERAIQHFPAVWEKQNLPGMTRLKKNALTFDKAFTNSCKCSPARSTWAGPQYSFRATSSSGSGPAQVSWVVKSRGG